MNLEVIIQLLIDNGIGLSLTEQDSLKIKSRNGEIDAAILACIKENKQALVDWLKGMENVPGQAQQPSRLERSDCGASKASRLASFSQERLWLIDKLQPASSAYNLPITYTLSGNLDKGALIKAIELVAERHEVLRTGFKEENHVILQISNPSAIAPIKCISVKAEREDLLEEKINETLKSYSGLPFDLSVPPLFRVQIIEVSAVRNILQFVFHHSIFDGHSGQILFNEISHFYNRLCGYGNDRDLENLEFQYADAVDVQRERLTGPYFDRLVNFWKTQLAELPQVTELPTDFKRPLTQSSLGNHHSFVIPEHISSNLKKLRQEYGVTSFIFFMAVWNVLLYRYTGVEDIPIGTPISNRGGSRTEELIGFFVNTLVLRTKVGAGDRFSEFLSRAREVAFAAYEHGEMPFEKVVEALNPPRSLSYSPLFQVMFIFHEKNGRTAVLGDLRVDPIEHEVGSSIFDLVLEITETVHGLKGRLNYNTDLFAGETIERMAGNFEVLLEGIVANPQARIGELPLLTAQEKRLLLEEWNDTAAAYPEDASVIELFESQVKATPEAVAVSDEMGSVSYRELNEASNRLARYLRSEGVVKDTLVGLCVKRSVRMVVGMLGIMKAGGAYVPLDPEYPLARLAYMVEDAGATLVVTQRSLAETVPASAKALCLDDEALQVALSAQASGNLEERLGSQATACAIYTSGSTGEPKGVLLPHGSIVNRLWWMQSAFAAEADEVYVQKTGLNFVDHVAEIFQPLSQGTPLVILTNEQVKDMDQLVDAIRHHRISRITLVPSLLSLLADHERVGELGTLRLIVSSGEALSDQLARKVQERLPQVKLINLYGSTEVGADVTWSVYDAGQSRQDSVSIGKPIANSQVYVLDEAQQLLPVGAKGELYVGGDCLARGYLNREDEERARFVAHPHKAGERLYKTGDLVRWLPQGELHYLGRQDYQIKLRGMRLEAGEVEAQLKQLAGVRDAVVMVCAVRHDSDQRLVAYLVPQEELEEEWPKRQEQTRGWSEQCRKALKQKLPDYMVPELYIYLDRLPLTATGKVDRKALPAVQESDLPQAAYVAPRNDTEAVLCRLWQDVLKVEQVGVHDNFFDLGGHSLLATRLMSATRQALQVELPLKVLFEQPTVAGLSDSLAQWQQQSVLPPIEHQDRSQRLPVSYAQQRLWFIDRLEEGSAEYNLPLRFRFKGHFDTGVFRQALQEIVDRHEVLRTVIEEEDGQAYQAIREAVRVEVQETDLSGQDEEQQALSARRLSDADARRPFDLQQDVLLRAHVYKLGEEDHGVLLTIHHIAADGWSLGIVYKELSALYNAYRQGQGTPLSALKVQYADYAQWQREWLQGQELERQLGYWKRQLQGLPAVHSLPLDYARPARQRFEGKTHGQSVSQALLGRIQGYCRQEQSTLFMFLQSAFAVLLGRYSHESDIVMGSPIAGRLHSDVEPLIGLFVNTLVIRSDVSGNPRFSELLHKNRDTILQAYEHQYVPFEMLVEELQPERSLSHSPLFQIMLTLHNNERQPLQLHGLKEEAGIGSGSGIKYDLELTAAEYGGRLYLDWSYNTDLFAGETIERMAGNFEVLLEGIVANPQARIGELPLLTAQEKRLLLEEWNDTAAAYPEDASVIELFESQVKATPEAVAVSDETGSVSYRELNEASNRLARYLRSEGVVKDTLVGLCVKRSVRMVVGMLGIMKAGGAYVPLDPEYPLARLAYMVEDAGATLVVTQRSLAETVPASAKALCLDDEALQVALSAQASGNLEERLDPRQLAYVIYTSGSTGQPKGVCIEHRALCNFLVSMAAQPGFARTDRLLAVTSISFDIAELEIHLPLIQGGQVYVASTEATRDSQALQRLIEERDVTFMQATPATWRLLLDGSWKGKTDMVMLCGGEAWPLTLNQAVQPLVKAVWNVYGPTETTIWSTLERIEAKASEICMGRGIANTQIYVLDDQRSLVPVGGVGELYIGGHGLARGYWNKPEMTAERFIANPFEAGSKLYRTGDLVRWRGDARLEYLSRCDHQVKIRGFRIECGEIEAQLLQMEEIKEAAVIAKKQNNEQYNLVGYLIFKEKPEDSEVKAKIADIKAVLGKRLPNYMVPGQWSVMTEFPLTLNGKLDRKTLALREPGVFCQAVFASPTTKEEMELAAAYAEILDISVDAISKEDNFFNIGGHSLLAVRLVNRVNERLSIKLSIKDIFTHETLKDLANTAASRINVEHGKIKKTEDTNFPKLSYAQEQMLFLCHAVGHGGHHYNIPLAFRLTGNIDIDCLVHAIKAVVCRHDSLRTIFEFAEQEKEPKQKVIPESQISVKVVDVEERDLASQIKKGAQHVFDLFAGPLIKIEVLRVSDNDHVLFINVHHINFDGYSIGLMMREISHFYLSFLKKQAPSLPSLPIQYLDYALWQKEYSHSVYFKAHLAYWNLQLKNLPEPARLPFSTAIPNTTSNRGDLFEFSIDESLGRKIESMANHLGLTTYIYLLAVFYVQLWQLCEKDEIVIGTAVANRNRPEIENLIGLFVNTLPLRTAISGEMRFSEFLQKVKSVVLDVYEHQDVPFEKLVEITNPERNWGSNPIFQIMFNFNNTQRDNLAFHDAKVTLFHQHWKTSKMDVSLNVFQTGKGIFSANFEYKTDLFQEESMAAMAEHYVELLKTAAEMHDKTLLDFPIPHNDQSLNQIHAINDESDLIKMLAG